MIPRMRRAPDKNRIEKLGAVLGDVVKEFNEAQARLLCRDPRGYVIAIRRCNVLLKDQARPLAELLAYPPGLRARAKE